MPCAVRPEVDWIVSTLDVNMLSIVAIASLTPRFCSPLVLLGLH
jgi:hypothetical protein